MSDVFILGAGFSKAINDAMPTMKELSEEVIARLKPSPFPIQETLYDLGNNLELWMTYLSQQQPWLREEHHYRNLALAVDVRRHIGDVIVERTNASTKAPIPPWLIPLIKHWHTQRASVITLNYDTLVERVTVVIEGSEDFLTESIYPPYLTNVLTRSGEGTDRSRRKDTFSYFKLHGSTNLYYSGRQSFYGETIFFSKPSIWGNDEHELEYQSEIRKMSGDKEVLIIPPVTDKLTYFNNETVRRLWQEASDAVQAASRMFVIGYSLPPADIGMRFFLQYSQPSKGTAVYIVDQDAEVVARYEELLPKLKVKSEFAGQTEVVSKFVGKYAELPAI